MKIRKITNRITSLLLVLSLMLVASATSFAAGAEVEQATQDVATPYISSSTTVFEDAGYFRYDDGGHKFIDFTVHETGAYKIYYSVQGEYASAELNFWLTNRGNSIRWWNGTGTVRGVETFNLSAGTTYTLKLVCDRPNNFVAYSFIVEKV